MQRHFLSNMSEIQFNFELNCFVKDTDKTRLLYMRFPLNSVQEICDRFFYSTWKFGKEVKKSVFVS